MQFFVPGAMEPRTAEVLWSLTRERLESMLKTSIWERRIHALSIRDNGGQVRIAIGEPFDGEEVLMIFEGTHLLICTAGRGMYRGKPIAVPLERATVVEFFDA